MHTRVPEIVRPPLEKFLTLMDAELPGFLAAFYLHGSIALGAFNERFGDIDFIFRR